MKKLTLALLLISFCNISSQDLDSLYTEYLKLKQTPSSAVQADGGILQGEKCGFALSGAIAENFLKFSPERQRVLKSLASRPTRQVYIDTRYFRIHYDTSGTNAIGYDLNDFIIATDSVYNFEINILGYPVPPSDGMEGGSNLYDIYLQNLSRGTYGYTEFETELSGNKWISYIVMDNDFSGFYTQGIEAARVTIAHEFHHAIQIGNYGFRSADTYYYEITSTSMEEFVFDDVNDYYGSLKDYFNKTYQTISRNNGYNLAILNIYLQQNFGHDLIKHIWELMPQKPFLNALEDALVEKGTTFKNEFNRFGIWTFFTGERSKPGYFEEAEEYPLVRPVTTMEFNAPSSEVTVSSAPVSNSFIMFTSSIDTIVALVTNADLANGVSSTSTLTEFRYGIYDSPIEGSARITDDYYSKLTSNNESLFADVTFINDDLPEPEVPDTNLEPYPLPFRYSSHAVINIPIKVELGYDVQFMVLTSGLDLVYSWEDIYAGGPKLVSWDARKVNGDKLSTGVYVYVVRCANNVTKGKLVIFND